MVKNHLDGEEWWCLPGGAIEEDETPADAAIRELKEECCVDGQIIRETSVVIYPPGDRAYTFEVYIGTQEPIIGNDPELDGGILDVRWLTLAEIPERDRAFLWAAGLFGIGSFLDEVSAWGDSISYPESER